MILKVLFNRDQIERSKGDVLLYIVRLMKRKVCMVLLQGPNKSQAILHSALICELNRGIATSNIVAYSERVSKLAKPKVFSYRRQIVRILS